jgi:hypothetical protein
LNNWIASLWYEIFRMRPFRFNIANIPIIAASLHFVSKLMTLICKSSTKYYIFELPIWTYLAAEINWLAQEKKKNCNCWWWT